MAILLSIIIVLLLIIVLVIPDARDILFMLFRGATFLLGCVLCLLTLTVFFLTDSISVLLLIFGGGFALYALVKLDDARLDKIYKEKYSAKNDGHIKRLPWWKNPLKKPTVIKNGKEEIQKWG